VTEPDAYAGKVIFTAITLTSSNGAKPNGAGMAQIASIYEAAKAETLDDYEGDEHDLARLISGKPAWVRAGHKEPKGKRDWDNSVTRWISPVAHRGMGDWWTEATGQPAWSGGQKSGEKPEPPKPNVFDNLALREAEPETDYDDASDPSAEAEAASKPEETPSQPLREPLALREQESIVVSRPRPIATPKASKLAEAKPPAPAPVDDPFGGFGVGGGSKAEAKPEPEPEPEDGLTRPDWGVHPEKPSEASSLPDFLRDEDGYFPDDYAEPKPPETRRSKIPMKGD
jgi:hypothetical protein